jgi:TonB family protein
LTHPSYNRARALSALAFALGLVAPRQGAQAQANGQVSGVVSDSADVPIASAEVRITGWPYPATTDARGVFTFAHVPAGEATLSVRRLGFVPSSVTLRLNDANAGVKGIVIRLAHLPTFLKTVTVESKRMNYTGRLAGYYQRLEKKSNGYFITREQIDRENPRSLQQLLQNVPAISGNRMRGGGAGVRMRGRNCAPLVWLDSTPMPAGEVDLNGLSPQTIQGIELYLGSTTAPARYTLNRDASSCGTIIIWSRGPDTEPEPVNHRARKDLERMIASLSVFTADQVDVKAQPLQNPMPVSYPPSLFAEGIAGSVVAEFVVDTAGVVEEGTVGIVSSTHPLFSAAVKLAVESAKFTVAQKGGTRVRQLVQQPFLFVPPRPASTR